MIAPIFSPPPAQTPEQGSAGVIYGLQQSRTFAIGDTSEVQVIDQVRAPFLWRFSVFGNVLARVVYGTVATREYRDLRTPLIMTVPGQLAVYVRNLDPDVAAAYSVTCTQATGGARASARRAVDASGGAVALSENAAFFTALSASTLTIAGLAVSVAASLTVPLVAGSSLLTGTGFEEFEA